MSINKGKFTIYVRYHKAKYWSVSIFDAKVDGRNKSCVVVDGKLTAISSTTASLFRSSIVERTLNV